jgi:hypothetical protein
MLNLKEVADAGNLFVFKIYFMGNIPVTLWVSLASIKKSRSDGS